MASTRKPTNQKGKANLNKAIKTVPTLTRSYFEKTTEVLKEPGEISLTTTDAINNLVNDDVFKLNHNGNTLYEVLGLSEDESTKLLTQSRLTLQGPELRSIRVEKIVNQCLKNKKLLALLIWHLSR